MKKKDDQGESQEIQEIESLVRKTSITWKTDATAVRDVQTIDTVHQTSDPDTSISQLILT